MATFNSAERLEPCLESISRLIPVKRLIVVDRFSNDGTPEIARRYGAEVHSLEAGIGAARLLALRLAATDRVLFVDSDVEIVRQDFFSVAARLFEIPGPAPSSVAPSIIDSSLGFHWDLPWSLVTGA